MAGKARKAVTIVGVTTLGLVGVLELGLRVAGDREKALNQNLQRLHRPWVQLMEGDLFQPLPDPVRRYSLRPRVEVQVDDQTFRVNSYRGRGEELPPEKPPGERRMLAIGDSFCFGLWSDEDETLVGHLARLANEADPDGDPWKTINLGVPGYHTGQQLRALEQDGLPLDPDLVVLYFNTNDIVSEGFFYDEELQVLHSDHSPLPQGVRRALWNSHLYGWIVRRLERRHHARGSPHLDPNTPWAHVREDNQQATRESLARIAELCAERDIPLFMVHQPLMTWSGDTWDADWPILPLVDWMEEVRAELGISGVNLLGWVRCNTDGVDRGPRRPPEEHYFMLERYFADESVQQVVAAMDRGETADFEMPAEPDFHLTGEGYGHMARVVFDAMLEQGVFDE